MKSISHGGEAAVVRTADSGHLEDSDVRQNPRAVLENFGSILNDAGRNGLEVSTVVDTQSVQLSLEASNVS